MHLFQYFVNQCRSLSKNLSRHEQHSSKCSRTLSFGSKGPAKSHASVAKPRTLVVLHQGVTLNLIISSAEKRHIQTDQWIVGLIARNPFYKKERLPREFEVDGSLPYDLLQFELLLCDLRDHLELGNTVDYYALEGIETTETEHVQIIRPFGTWNNITKGAKSEAQLQKDAKHDLDSILLNLNRGPTLRTVSRAPRKRSS